MTVTKQMLLLLTFLTAAATGLVFAQESSHPDIEITYNKTSSVIFPAAITSVDQGSREVLAQKAKGVNNILQLKAGRINFRETNLTVITADGHLHHFVVKYADNPENFTVQINPSPTREDLPLMFRSEMTETELEGHAHAILTRKQHRSLQAYSRHDMKVILRGIYIEGNVMFFHLGLSNKSNIPYHTEVIRFSIRDKRQPTRTASQERTESPIYQTGNASVITGKSSQDLVYAIPVFTIPDAKRFHIELKEQRGGRHLRLEVKNKRIIRAQRITPGP